LIEVAIIRPGWREISYGSGETWTEAKKLALKEVNTRRSVKYWEVITCKDPSTVNWKTACGYYAVPFDWACAQGY